MWLTSEETSYKNSSSTYSNDIVYNINLDAEVNTCVIITISIIESTFDKLPYPYIT